MRFTGHRSIAFTALLGALTLLLGTTPADANPDKKRGGPKPGAKQSHRPPKPPATGPTDAIRNHLDRQDGPPADDPPPQAPPKQPEPDPEDDDVGDGGLDHLFDDDDDPKAVEFERLTASIDEIEKDIALLTGDIEDLKKDFLESDAGQQAGAILEGLAEIYAEQSATNLDRMHGELADVDTNDPDEAKVLEAAIRDAHADRQAEIRDQHETAIDTTLEIQMGIHAPSLGQEYDDLKTDLGDLQSEKAETQKLLNDLITSD